MTFGPVTIVRPGASVTVAAMGPQGLQGIPGQDGAPGAVGPTTWAQLVVWQSGQTYQPGPPASLVSMNGSTYACTTVHTSGTFLNDLANGNWIVVASIGMQGPSGTPGSTWYSGSGLPSPLVGVAGDYFLRTDTYDVLIKVSGDWAAIANLKGLPGTNGNTVASGSGAPPASIGNTGDFYLDTTAIVIYGPKAVSGWPSTGTSLIGPSGPGNGSVNPNGPTTQGNNAVFGANSTIIQDGGRPGYVVVDTPSSPYTSVNRDEVWWNTASAAAVQLLPASPTAGTRVRAMRSGANTVTVQQNGNTIAGAASDLVLDRDMHGVELIWDATLSTWFVVLIQHA